jgi:hypothetical protein
MTRNVLLPLSAALLLAGLNARGGGAPLETDADSQNSQPGRQTEVIASPNPTIKESDSPADAPNPPVTSKKVEATNTTRQAPMSTSRKRKRPTRPRD